MVKVDLGIVDDRLDLTANNRERPMGLFDHYRINVPGASSTIRQSFTVNDIASTPLDPLIASGERGANAITRDAAGNAVNMLASRSTSTTAVHLAMMITC
jgi:hypothetical protein